MIENFSRTEMLLGDSAMERLKNSRIAVFGIGGVGSYAAEGLSRAGVGKFLLVDGDTIDATNINRQIHATMKTIGEKKCLAMKRRMLEINPDAEIEILDEFYTPENAEKFFTGKFDFIIDAVDMVSAKLSIICEAQSRDIPVISAMGAGNKLDPTRFEVADIYETSVCPLAKVMRRELKKRGIEKLTVVYSKELPVSPGNLPDEVNCRRAVPGSISFVPSVAGLIIAGETVKRIVNLSENKIHSEERR